MELKTELEKLKKYIGKPGKSFDKQLAIIKKNFPSQKDKVVIDKFIRKEMNELTMHLDEFIQETSLKLQLAEVSEIVSLSYIAKNYFNKTSQWLYARINGNFVNGKPGKLKPEDVNTLNFALQDIAKKIGSTKISV
ncbi:DUF5053 domain-containing protein [Parafilimonas sp.]|uniref:DUF5053 domain-containing protein n=1 Tax=Parafilimonas sp. TaxID=1969739 RepID=UPI0039E30A34